MLETNQNEESKFVDSEFKRAAAEAFVEMLPECCKLHLKTMIERQYQSGDCSEMDYVFKLCGGKIEEANPLNEL